MADQPPGAGFNPHVWGQLNDAASQTNQRPRGGRGRGPSLGSRQGPGYGTQPPSMNPYAAPMSPPFQSPPPSMDSFPPLGSQAQPAATAKPMSPVSPQAFNQPPSRGSTYHRAPPRDFYHRGPSSPHGYGHHGRGPHFNHNSRSAHQQSYDNFRRPPAPGGNLYSPTAPPASFLGPFPSYDDKERAFREQVMAQSDYLNKAQVATRQKYQLKQDEQILKEDFRRHLESIFQQSLAEKYPSIAVGEIRLRCYGSLNNGFGLAQCDMDLLLALPEEIDLINKDAPDAPNDNANPSVDSSQQQGAASAALEAVIDPETDDDKFEVALRLEGALLDLGIGARLLTKTRVPILRVCERPNEELLENLRAYRKETLEAAEALKEKTVNQHADTPPDLSMSDIASALQELSSEEAAAQVILPASPSKNKQPSLEFTGDCGIQCDINFTNFVAIHNTRLLREYCLYDSRVAQIGTFVKAWAKIRDINTPYWGTLSSYGYILMVLHYLMNVAQPPVIPNLQDLAITQDSWNPEPVPKFEGKFDIRFWQDQATIEAYKAQQPRNRESTGHLLRGFFWYYSAREGFNFKNDVISIRSRGGILKKYHKGWTEAKWADQKKNVRQRYLLAIEDPFEVDHNVARVVGHNGIVAIRDEFRRAWSIISSVGGPNASTEDLLDVVEERGDLLRKDQEHHREKIRRMKQDLEAKEKEALKGVSMQNDQHEGENQEQIQQQPPGQSEKIETGTLDQTPWSHPSPPSKPSHRRRSPNPQLTQDDGGTQVKPRHLKRGRTRKVKAESDNEDHDEDRSESVARIEAKTWQRSGDVGELKAEGSDSDSGPICSPSETCLRQGFDSNGNPIAWDISTQDGRWLQWRDNKIRQGRWRGVVNNPSLAAHDKRYPFDPRRPAPEDCDEYRLANELFWVNRAPYPLNRNPDITSTETAIVAAIPKPGVIIRTRQKGRRRVVKRKSSSPTATGHEQSSGQAPAVASEIPEQHDVKTDAPAAINESDDWAKRAEAWHQDTDRDTASSQGPVKPDEAATEAWAEIAQPAQPHPEAWDSVGFEESHTETDPRDSKGDGWGTPPSWKSTTMDVETASICTNPYPNEGPYCPNDNTHTSKEFRSTFKGSTPPQRHWRGTRHTSVDSDMITRAQRARALSGPHLSNTLLTGDARLDPQDWWQPVGLPIAWDISTAGGTWLRKRDTYIRLGTFQYPRGPHLQALHKLFPYDSRMPRWKLATHNAQLQAFYRYSLWPQGLRPPISSASRGQRGGSSAPEMNIIQPKVSTQTTIVTDSEEWPQYSLLQRPPPHSKAADFVSMFSPEDLAHKPREADSVVSDEAEEMPDSAFIRSRRLAYFADKEQRENGDDEAEDEETIRNIMMFMQQAGIGSGNGISDGSMHRRIDPTSMANYKPYSEQPGSGVGSMTTAEQNSFSTSFDPACEAEGMPKYPSVNAEETSKVPLTLYPDISANDRPRDEDPRIMPIPRDQGFKFDVRQLRDLAVIKEGGNGCAVQGCEFEIEGEHEWTGSGAVDWVQSDFAYEESKVSMEKPYEYGRGDEEGYLDELPGMGI